MAKAKADFEGRVVIENNPASPDVLVKVRKEGDGKISNGVHTPGGDEMYEKGETFVVARLIAEELEARYFVDILDTEPEPKKADK